MADLDVVLINVDKTFDGDVRAVIDFNAEIEHGEFVAMLGPSGCGKTTTLRMIGGLEEVTEGKIYIAGEDVTDLPPSQRDTSMMFPELRALPPTATSTRTSSSASRSRASSAASAIARCARCWRWSASTSLRTATRGT